MNDVKSVAIVFANLKGNIGDFAIFDAMLRSISNAYPDHTIDVYPHAFLNVDEQRLSAFLAEGEIDFEIVGETFYFPTPEILKRFFRFGFWPYIQRYLVFQSAKKSYAHAERFSDYDAIFISGGDHWNGMKLGISMFGTLRAIASHNKNIFAYPFSLNPAVQTYNKKNDLRRYFSLIRQPLIVRDSTSQDFLAGLGIETVLGHDTVFELSRIAKNIVGLPNRDSGRVLLVLAKGDDRKIRQTSMHRLIEDLQSSGHTVELLSTCELEDKEIFESEARHFGITARAPITWQETVAELRQSSIVVTNRLHCLILGTFAECTLFPVADREKSKAFVRDTQLSHYANCVDEISNEALEAAIHDRDQIVGLMRAYREASAECATSPIIDR